MERNVIAPTAARTDTRHDPLTYIGPDRQAVLPPTNLPVPVGIFMNMAHVPPRLAKTFHLFIFKNDQKRNTNILFCLYLKQNLSH
jgi:regulator of nonsense transcripts 1